MSSSEIQSPEVGMHTGFLRPLWAKQTRHNIPVDHNV